MNRMRPPDCSRCALAVRCLAGGWQRVLLPAGYAPGTYEFIYDLGAPARWVVPISWDRGMLVLRYCHPRERYPVLFRVAAVALERLAYYGATGGELLRAAAHLPGSPVVP